MSAAAAPGRAERQGLVLFGIVALAMLASSMQNSMISVAFPDLIEDLHAPLRWAGWTLTAFTLSQAVSMPIVGKLSDELGRRRVFVSGLTLFALASLAAALAPNIWLLIAARAVQGLAGGSLLPSAYGIIGDAFPERRTQFIGLLSAIFPIGSILGPNIGGVVVDHFGWRWTFLMNVPIGLTVVLLALRMMPRGTETRRAQPIDFTGAALLALSVGTLIYALTELGRRNGDPSYALVSAGAVIAVAALWVFLRHEGRTRAPLLDLRLVRQREFAFVNALNFFYGASIFGLFSFIPLYAQTEYGMSASESGALLTPRALGMIGTSVLAAWLLPRTGYRRPIMMGLLGMSGIYAVMSLGLHTPAVLGLHFSDFAFLTLLVALTGIGFGMAGPAANNAAIELAPDRIAVITGLRGMFRMLGGSIATALIVLVMSRSDTPEAGLELAFAGLAVSTALTTLLVLGVPDGRPQARARPVALPADLPADGTAAAASRAGEASAPS